MLTRVLLFLTPWTVACQAPLSMGILSRQEYWNEYPFPSLGDPTKRSNPSLPHCRQILYCLSHQGGPNKYIHT